MTCNIFMNILFQYQHFPDSGGVLSKPIKNLIREEKMKNQDLINHINVQTNTIPTKLDSNVIAETAHGIALYYKDKKFVCQTFFTQPILGEINKVTGLETAADVHIRAIEWIGPNLFHIRLMGDETHVRTMCEGKTFYDLLRGISGTLNKDVRSRRYLETTRKMMDWNCIVSLDREKYNLLNLVRLENKDLRINNIIILGDRIMGLTDDHRVVQGQLTPDILLRTEERIRVMLLQNVNELGKINLLGKVPNSENTFLVTVDNTIYQFDVWGEMVHLQTLDESVKQIHSINFNHTRTIMATSNGLYEMDVQELPNMVKTSGLPRQIINPHLNQNFRLALYVEDPYIIGNNPPLGIFAKTDKDEVLFF